MKSAAPDDARFSVDAFHRGAFMLVQPVGRGHRAGMDAMMLAAAVPADFGGTLVDLGAGAGAAGLAVLARLAGATATLVEREPDMLDCARRTLALPLNAAFAARARIVEADATLVGRSRVAAGLADASADFAIMNPPFNDPRDRRTGDHLRSAAHVMTDGLFDAWIRTAAAVVRPRGGLALIARPQSLGEILAALRGRFGAAEIMPIHPRADQDAIRIVVRARRASRKPLRLAPPLTLHDADACVSARADAIANGEAVLFENREAAGLPART